MALYRHILIPLENGPADHAILEHIKPLARLSDAYILLIHVADGWAARNFQRLNLVESEEMKADRAYLEARVADLRQEGFVADFVLALGEPSDEIIKLAKSREIDLIAMSTHGHRFWRDLLYGTTADKVRHLVDIPVLMLKAKI